MPYDGDFVPLLPIFTGEVAFHGLPPINVFFSYSQREMSFSDKVSQYLAKDWVSSVDEDGVFTHDQDAAVGMVRVYPFNVWRDKESIRPATPWREAIVDGVKRCDVFVVLVPTEHSVRVALECGMAMGLGKPIVPIARDASLLTEYGLDHLQLFPWVKFDDGDLLRLLFEMAGRGMSQFTRYVVHSYV